MKILVLGSAGMLGHKMVERLRLYFSEVHGVSREMGLDASNTESVKYVLESVQPQVVVNCVGIIKQRRQEFEQSIAVNALLPHALQRICLGMGAYLIHFSTDCVFSGERGRYTEDDLTDPEDVYGRTKQLGEVVAENALTLRTSIVGREKGNYKGLLEWFLHQPNGAEVTGFERAIWSGVTTNWLSDVTAFLVKTPLYGLYQVAAPPVTKYQLLNLFRTVYERQDIEITPVMQPVCDRSLRGNKFQHATGIQTPELEILLHEQREQDKGKYAL